ncbi:hypothetical protein RQP54_04995 [Curvibacter sp. APW13]|uniref:hypothetical protein n=1 Tax=Curvibacter sp. APW13 TaxID=3077236 RepID=UPI0028DD7956|nr:hypothetical protein [Curvibacter sp. APW13]MDT8990215.1 hypothetical protein [Curvibacter sp. APW13]
MSVRWPWRRPSSSARLVVSWADGVLSYVVAKPLGGERFEIKAAGVERRGDDALEAFAARLAALGLKGLAAQAMLRPAQYQFLQIDAPQVPPEEMRAAARYQIKDLVTAHIDDITLDVLKVGDGQYKAGELLFVVAAANAVVRELLDLSDAMQWDVRVVDVQETAQRNLQQLLARTEGRAERADALLTMADDRQGLLTISANDELFFTRRLDLPVGFMAMSWGDSGAAPVAEQAYVPVGEYVPDYAVGGEAFGADYSAGMVDYSATGQGAHQRVVVELQRSLDLWDRTWRDLPLQGLRVAAGERSAEMVQWLARELGMVVQAIDLSAQFPGWAALPAGERMECWPLLGLLLRTETRTL